MASSQPLTQRLLEASKALGWITKAGTNKDQGYDFVRAVDVFDHARDALNKCGVVWLFSTTDHDITVIETGKGTRYLHKMSGEYRFINADDKNDQLVGTVQGSTVASGDKGAWVVTTGLLKYALIQALLLPTGDDPEAQEDADKPERQPGAKAPANPPSSPFTDTVKKPDAVKVGLTEPQRKKLFALFEKEGITESPSRRYVTFQLVGKNSVKEMSGADLDTILGFFKANDGVDDLKVRALAAAA